MDDAIFSIPRLMPSFWGGKVKWIIERSGTGINGWSNRSSRKSTRLIYRKLKSIYNFDDVDSASKFKYYSEELRFGDGYVTALNKNLL